MPYVTEISLFAAAFIAAFAYGEGVSKSLAAKIRAMSTNRRCAAIGVLGARLRAWLSRPPG